MVLILISLVGITYGWVWCSPDAHVLDPLTRRVDQLLDRDGDLAEYLRRGRNCPPCMGFQGNIGAWFIFGGGLELAGIGYVLAGVAVHMIWMETLGLMTDLRRGFDAD